MAQLVSGYLYEQIINGFIAVDSPLTRENTLVYAKPLQLFYGISNTITLQVKNQDQKKYGLQGMSLKFYLISPDNQELIYSAAMYLNFARVGQATVTIPESVMDGLAAGEYRYSIIATDEEGNAYPIYTDGGYNGQGVAVLENNLLPQHVPSVDAVLAAPMGNVTTSSAVLIKPRAQTSAAIITTQIFGTDFNGQVTIQATMDQNGTTWFDVDTLTLIMFTGTELINITGKYAAVRAKITTDSGEITKVYIRT